MYNVIENIYTMLRNFAGLLIACLGVIGIEIVGLQTVDLKLKILFQIIIFILTSIYLIIKITQKLKIKKDEKNN